MGGPIRPLPLRPIKRSATSVARKNAKDERERDCSACGSRRFNSFRCHVAKLPLEKSLSLAERVNLLATRATRDSALIFWKSRFQRMIAERADYAIVTANLFEPFCIRVYPVERRLKRAANEALLSTGLPALRDAMLRHHPVNSLRRVQCEIMFAPRSQSVYLKASVFA
jgi:hypothetical protein